MRIAVSGSHSLGKSTVVNDWVAAHPEYRREEEPYRALSLAGPYEIRFRDASTRLQNGIQMYYSISRVHRFSACTADVIFDRAPVDSIAYSVYTANQGTTDIDAAFVETLVPAVRESLDHLDILAFVPKTDDWPVEMEADGIRPVDHASGRFMLPTGISGPIPAPVRPTATWALCLCERPANGIRDGRRRIHQSREFLLRVRSKRQRAAAGGLACAAWRVWQ